MPGDVYISGGENVINLTAPNLAQTRLTPNYLRMLTVLAAPIGSATGAALRGRPLDVLGEWERLCEAVNARDPVGHAGAPWAVVRLPNPTIGSLRDALAGHGAPYQVLHFGCHGNDQGLYLEDDLGREALVTIDRLVEAIRPGSTRPAPDLVILNACETLAVARALVERAGVKTVIAALGRIPDAEAKLLAERVYRRLAAGCTVEEGLDEFKRTLNEEMGERGQGEPRLRPTWPGAPEPGVQARGYSVQLVGDAKLCLTADAPQADSPLFILNAVPHTVSLPMGPILRFVGRREELLRLGAWLQMTGRRFFAISGIGGIGKTALVLSAALRHSHRFDAFVFATAKDEPDFGPLQVLGAIDAVLGLKTAPDLAADPVTGIATRLKTYRLLLVLDNLESLSRAQTTALARGLDALVPASGSRVLMTLRPRERDALTSLAGLEGITLVGLDHASAVRLVWQEAAHQPGDLTGLVRDVDELAAAAFLHPGILRLAVPMIASHGWAGTMTRLRSLRGREIEQAYENFIGQMIDDLERREPGSLAALHAALPFRGGAELARLQWVIHGAKVEADNAAKIEIEDRLKLLVMANVLTRTGEARFDLDAPVRLYLEQRRPPDADEAALYELRHAEAFVEKAQEDERKWYKNEASLAALPEWSNIVAALDRLTAAGGTGRQAAVLLVAYVTAMPNILRNTYDARRSGWISTALVAARAVGDRPGEANVLKAQGDVLAFQKQNREALGRYEAALGLYRAVGARLGEANVLRAQGDVLAFQKQNEEALARYEAALGLYRAMGDRLGEANVLQAQGDVLAFQGQNEEALARYEAALGLYRAVGDRLGEANVLAGQGQVALLEGQQAEADRLLEEAVALYRRIGDRYSVPAKTGNYGWALLRADQPDRARPYLLRAAEEFAAMGLDDYAARHLQAAGVSTDPRELKNQFRTAIAQLRETGDQGRLVPGLAAMCQICRQLEDWPGLRAAAEELVALGAADADTWEALGDARSKQEDGAGAVEAYQQAVRLAPEAPMLRRNYANSLIALSQLDEAEAQLDAAERLEPDAAYLALRRGELALARGDRAAAVRWAEEALRRNPGWDEARELLAKAQGGGNPADS